jgi:hypothetical protein
MIQRTQQVENNGVPISSPKTSNGSRKGCHIYISKIGFARHILKTFAVGLFRYFFFLLTFLSRLSINFGKVASAAQFFRSLTLIIGLIIEGIMNMRAASGKD